jgi:putative SOS response-associated peptidase YedK
MCGRYTLFESKDLGPRFNLAKQPRFVSRDNYNVAPRQWLPVVLEDETAGRIVESMQWGFIPPWNNDPTQGIRPINTKSETVFDSRMWLGAVRHHRCLVPSRGFYEWKTVNEKMKVPYFVHPKDQKLFGFAGIYSIWNDAEGRPLYSFSILTTAPNREMKPIHDRMPVILRPEQEASWLNLHASKRDQLAELLVPYEDGALEIYRVSEDVNSPRHNDPYLVEAVKE